MQSKAATVEQYLAELPEDRRAALQAVRTVILKNLDKNYEEGMQYGMIGYFVPHRVFPAGYHCDPRQPLPFAGLASQKNHMSLYIMTNYTDGPEAKWFKAAWAKSGIKLDMGKCCIRFKKLDDLPLDVVGEAIRRIPAERHIAWYEAAFPASKKTRPSPKATGGDKKKTAQATSAKKKAAPNRKATQPSARKAPRTVAAPSAATTRPRKPAKSTRKA